MVGLGEIRSEEGEGTGSCRVKRGLRKEQRFLDSVTNQVTRSNDRENVDQHPSRGKIEKEDTDA